MLCPMRRRSSPRCCVFRPANVCFCFWISPHLAVRCSKLMESHSIAWSCHKMELRIIQHIFISKLLCLPLFNYEKECFCLKSGLITFPMCRNFPVSAEIHPQWLILGGWIHSGCMESQLILFFSWSSHILAWRQNMTNTNVSTRVRVIQGKNYLLEDKKKYLIEFFATKISITQ